MSFPPPLSPSPVAAAFDRLVWNPLVLDKLRLSGSEKTILRKWAEQPIATSMDTTSEENVIVSYVTVLCKILTEASHQTSSSSRVSRLEEDKRLSEKEALQLLYADPMGISAHYAATQLYDIIMSLQEEKHKVTIASVFFSDDDNPRLVTVEGWEHALLSVLHYGDDGDAFAQRTAALCLAHILIAGCPSTQQQRLLQQQSEQQKAINTLQSSFVSFERIYEPLHTLVSWMKFQLESSNITSLSLVTPTLMVLMDCREARQVFVTSGGIAYIARNLVRQHNNTNSRIRTDFIEYGRTSSSVQQMYELCFCLWNMSYDCNSSTCVRNRFVRDGAVVVAALVDLVVAAPREKVVRVALSALRNLATISHDDECIGEEEDYYYFGVTATTNTSSRTMRIDGSFFVKQMIHYGLLKPIDFMMRERQWTTDPDMIDDLEVLYKLLHENNRIEMSNWDAYQQEVESGRLTWGITHTEKFFYQNAKQMEGPEGDFAIVKELLQLLIVNDDEKDDDDTLAIACFDIGEFVRHYPNGRSIAKSLGAKDVVMQLMDHKNADVQRQALMCVSKILLRHWADVQT